MKFIKPTSEPLNIEELRLYCLSKAATDESLPFGEDTLVFKVLGKMFALTSLSSTELSVNLKCEPSQAIELREEYPGTVLPGYHMSKKHWNTVMIDGTLPDETLKQWIDNSYDLVVSGLPQKLRNQII